MKNQLSRPMECVVLAAAALLAACGGGGGGDEGGASAPKGASQVPATALQGPEGLAAFQKGLHVNGTDSTSPPLILGDARLPSSDTAQAVAVN